MTEPCASFSATSNAAFEPSRAFFAAASHALFEAAAASFWALVAFAELAAFVLAIMCFSAASAAFI